MNPAVQIEEAAAPPDPRFEAASRAAHGKVFERSVRLQHFLMDVVERALAGRVDEINEQQLGTRIFGKPPDYNPAEDNTVRVQARILRKKLAEYYDGEGFDDPIHIVIPKGGYVPVFEPRIAAVPPPAAAPVLAKPFPLAAVLGCVCAVLLVSTGWLFAERERLLSMLPSAAPDFGPLTSLVVGPNVKRTVIVMADSGFVAAQELAGHEISLDDYSGAGYRKSVEAGANPVTPGFWGYFLTRRYTSMADVNVYGRLLQSHPESWKSLEVRHARDLSVRDFRQHSFVLLGSPRSNPWLRAFDDKLNFRFVSNDKDRQASIHNQNPAAGEPADYFTDMPSGSGRGFAYIALVPNLAETGNVLVLAGNTMAATEMATEYACDRAASRKLAQLWGLKSVKDVRSFELLFETSIVADTAKSSKLVASRHAMRQGL